MKYTQLTLPDLFDAFASSEPVPGGGSASAVAGALGASLLIMVASLPRSRTNVPEETADLAEAATRLRPLLETLTSCIDDDGEAYAEVVHARRRPHTTEADKAARAEAIQMATKRAIETPLDIQRACQQALRGALVVAASGSRHASSDTGVAIELLMAALRGAGLNVDINLSSISDPAYVERVKTERQQLEADGAADAEQVRQLL